MKLSAILKHDLSYCDPKLKDQFHRTAKAQLKKVAEAMGLSPDQYDLRSNKGGIAVSGEVVLHTDSVYVMVSQFITSNRYVMYRTCKGRKDYSGGTNHYCTAEALEDPEQFVKTELQYRLEGRRP
jgi:hypothetical protein